MSEREWLTKDEFFADEDPEARARWERTALARAVAFAVQRYRMGHKLSQRALAAKLGVKQPHVARLELGERNPTMETLERLATVLGLRFVVDVAPGDRADQPPLPAGVRVLEDLTTAGGSRVLVAAG